MSKGLEIVIGDCEIHPSAKICAGVIIGKQYRKFLDGSQEEAGKTIVDEDTFVGYYSVVGSGSRIAKGTIIDDHCIIESRVTIGKKSLITYRAQVCNDVNIGDNSIIGGFVGERTQVGSNCRIFGNIVHLQHNPLLEWDADESTEGAPIIHDYAFIGFNALVAGDITIGRKAYVCAGAVITRSVPDLHVASGRNQIVHYSEWKGRLKLSPFFLDNGE